MENEGTSKVTGDKTVMENIDLITEVNVTESMMQAKKPGTSAASGVLGDKTVMENVELGTVQNVMKSVMENTVPARMENEGTSKVTGDKTVMENIDLITEVNVTESMMQAKKPGTSAASGVSGDDTMMENVELGTEQKVMKSMTEDTVKGSLLHDPTYKGKKVQKKKQQEQAKPVAFNSKKFYGVDGMLLERDDGSYYPRIVNDKKRQEVSLNLFKIEEEERAKFGGKLPKITDRQLLENIHNVYFDVYNDSLKKNYY